MPWRAVLVLALAVLAGGCGGDSAADEALKETQGKLDDIRSGRLSMRVLASSLPAPDGRGVGFELDGAFSVGKAKGSLPIADLRYTRVTGTSRRTTRFISTGSAAFLEVDGRTTRLSEEQVGDLRVESEGSGGGLEGLSLSSWVKDAKVSGGPAIDGVATERITGTGDPVPILNDLVALAEQLGAGEGALPRLEGEAAARVRRAAKATTADVVTGKRDRLLRRLDASISLAVTDPEVREALGELAGNQLHFALAIDDINRPVRVADPTVR